MNFDHRGNLWQQTCAEDPGAGPLGRDLRVDLAVIGGGFTGASAALEAASRGASVAVLEAGNIGQGGSGRNVGLVNAGLWLAPDEVIRQMGHDSGRQLISVLATGPDRVFSLIRSHGINCDPVQNGTLHCAHSPRGLRNLQNRHRQGTSLGAPVQLLSAEETIRRTGAAGLHGALFDPRAGTIQPLAYCRGLARAAREAGAQVFCETRATGISRKGGLWHLTAGAHNVRARSLLVATNAYHEPLTGLNAPQFISISFSQFATQPLSAKLRQEIVPGGEGCWDTALVMSSFRTDRAGRLVFGGIGNLEGAGGGVHATWAMRKLKRLFPKLSGYTLEHAWSGRIAMTSDHIPKIVEFGPRAYACMGYSGRGIAPGTLFGAAAARGLLAERREDLPILPVRNHAERFRGTRAAYYELGATLTHAIKPLP
ncbi:FAD-dependent oxidoreductase [Pseudophaeobacter sp. 1A16562]|uniref:NAD(P)/FAD-dependent oxidoreductase n=1 Tax=Pseudophaeobacter sp. 1A16562 TaxID=3098143 RepID=UPI0034D64593